jgi:hypothetical protein
MKLVYPDVKGAIPRAPAIVSMTVVSIGDNTVERRWRKLRNMAKPINALCIGITFTVPAWRPKYILAKHTAQPKRSPHTTALGVRASMTEGRQGSRADANGDATAPVPGMMFRRLALNARRGVSGIQRMQVPLEKLK